MIIGLKKYIPVIFLLFLVACKTPEKPMANTYHAYFDQTKKEYVKTPSINQAKLDTVVLIRPNLRSVSVAYTDTIPIVQELILEYGELAIPVEIINEKPPTYDTFLVAKEYAFEAELINSLFPIIPDTILNVLIQEEELTQVDTLNEVLSKYQLDSLKNDGDLLMIKKDSIQSILNAAIYDSILLDSARYFDEEGSLYYTQPEIIADTQRDLLDADSILSDLIAGAPWKVGDSIPFIRNMSNSFLDSILMLSFDTVYTEVYDPSKVVPQLSIDVLSDELSDTIYQTDQLILVDTVTFTIFYPKEKDIYIDMVRVKGGEFKIGSNDFDEDERPAYKINVSSFLLSKYEVTNYLFCFFLNDQKCDSLGRINGIKVIDLYHPMTRIQRNKWDGSFSVKKGYDQFPVVNVSWDGAQMYSHVTLGRLPSEAEWEYAARGGVYAKRYYTGWNKDDYEYEYRFSGGNYMRELGWIVDNSRGEVRVGGRLKGNELGLYDMSGNVWEWCYDKYNSTFYRTNNRSSNPMCLEGATVRVNRGGSWSSDAVYCRTTNRNYLKQSRYNSYLGFRYMRKW